DVRTRTRPARRRARQGREKPNGTGPVVMRVALWWRGLSPVMRAALLMLLGSSCVAAQWSGIRIASASLHTFEVVLFRNLIGFLVILPFLGRLGLHTLRTREPGRLALTSLGLLAAMLCFFVAVAEMPLAEAMALSFTKPLFATLGAALLLREVVRARRWSAVLVGFLGVLIVLRPGTQTISVFAVLLLLSSLLTAGVTLLIKRLAATESATTIVLYQALFMTALSLPLALLHWRMPTLAELPALIVVGALGTVSWLCVTRAFALVDASVVMPFEFARLPLTALAGYLLFAEVPTLWTWLGGAVIFASTVYITHREITASASTRAAATAATDSESVKTMP
ncbi:MAG TPA: DMT family transporter, partial [Geminicoccaceae bacterium]|nr:DMT family transporter [Geminicoccaceae bacterium]